MVLAWPDKLQDEIISLFETRYRLHKKVYCHRTVKSNEYIIADLLNNIITIVILNLNIYMIVLFHFLLMKQ